MDHEIGELWGFKLLRHVERVWEKPVTNLQQAHLYHWNVWTSTTRHDKWTLAHRKLVTGRNGEVADGEVCEVIDKLMGHHAEVSVMKFVLYFLQCHDCHCNMDKLQTK